MPDLIERRQDNWFMAEITTCGRQSPTTPLITVELRKGFSWYMWYGGGA